MRICELASKRIAIWGLGKEGMAIWKVLCHRFPDKVVGIFVETPVSPALDQGVASDTHVEFYEGKEQLAQLTQYQVVIKSPGVSLYRPEVIRAQQHGVHFVSGTSLWFAENPHIRTICVTGTKGKSTTASLIYQALQALGYCCVLAGNIGVPLWEVRQDPRHWLVMEMSSYQLADFEGQMDVGVIINLYPEHLDWHQSLANYYQDKIRPFQSCRQGVVVNHRNNELRQRVSGWENTVWFNHPSSFWVQDAAIYHRQEKILEREQCSLLGEHNLSNICAALTVLDHLQLPWQEAVPALCQFSGLPHRLFIVGTSDSDDILYVDDSISTTPESTIAAVLAFVPKPITLLLGGFDRGLHWQKFVDFLCQGHVHNVVTMAASGEKIAQLLSERSVPASLNLYPSKTLDQATEIAQQVTPSGGVVLLSPAAPSYGEFANFQERGQRFQELIRSFLHS